MKCIDDGSSRPEGAVCSYNGYLFVPSLSPQTVEQGRSAAQAAGLEVDIGTGLIEFGYIGRDSNRFVVKFLRQVASAIGTASGEVRCEITADHADPC